MTDIPQQEPSQDKKTAGDVAGNGGGADSQAPTTPEERIAALTAERDEMKDRMLRIAADFENWKKRARKDQTDGEARVRESLLKDFLEVVDNLDRATTAQAANAGNGQVDAAALLKGVNLVLRLFQTKLERHDVRPFESKGQPFDPKIHEAVSQIPSAEVAVGAVASEFQRGYRIGERLLRPAMVAVATAPAAKDEAPAAKDTAPAAKDTGKA